MMVVVEVGTALSRPPQIDRLSKIIVDVPFDGDFEASETEARIIACQMSCRDDVVMPVSATVVDIIAI